MQRRFCLSAAAVVFAATLLPAQTPHEGDFAISNFHFANGEQLPKLNIHYTTLGQPVRNAQGHV